MTTHPCSLCGQPADTVHLLPGVTEAAVAVLACPDHDPDGYWFKIKDWRAGHPVTTREHVREKYGGDHAARLVDRLLGTEGASAIYGSAPVSRPRPGRVYDAGQLMVEFDHEPELMATMRRCAHKLKVEYDLQQPDADPGECWAEAESAWALLDELAEATT